MELDFDFEDVANRSFGVGVETDNGTDFCKVSAEPEVKASLQDMVLDTKRAADKTLEEGHGPKIYDPAETHTQEEYLYLPLEHNLVEHLRNIHRANLARNNKALSDPRILSCYFTTMVDGSGRRLTALRRTSQFKGILKKHLVTVINDSVQKVERTVFQLDFNFDIVIDDYYIHILRPRGFESIGKIKAAILAAVQDNVDSIVAHMDFVEFSNIQEYARRHPKAARYLASIYSQGQMKNVDPDLLRNHCEESGIRISGPNEKMNVDDNHILDFLEVIDRRRYQIRLQRGGVRESYRAERRSPSSQEET